MARLGIAGLVAVLCAGCSSLVDPCEGVNLREQACVAIYLDSAPSFDTLTISASRAEGQTWAHSRSVANPEPTSTTFPIAVALLFDNKLLTPAPGDGAAARVTLTLIGVSAVNTAADTKSVQLPVSRRSEVHFALIANVDSSGGDAHDQSLSLDVAADGNAIDSAVAVDASPDGDAASEPDLTTQTSDPDLAECVPAAACPADIECGSISNGCDGTIVCGPPCRLLAINPPIANTGATITLEGTFSNTAMVKFPGGVMVAPATVGPHRLSVVVPAAASAGDLTVATGGDTTNAVSFRRAHFALGSIGRFEGVSDQTRIAPNVVPSQRPPVIQRIGDFLIAGELDRSVHRWLINADGSLFETKVDGALVLGRTDASAFAVGNRYYLVGGSASGSNRGTVEMAAIGEDGTVPSFTTLTSALVRPRSQHRTVVIGKYVYVIGGTNGALLGSIERAEILANGELGPFGELGVSLEEPRRGFAVVVAGNSLLVLGGRDATSARGSIEEATIAPDGVLSTFKKVTGGTLFHPRFNFEATVLGSTLIVSGGETGASSKLPIEYATLSASGLSSFTAGSTSLETNYGAVLAGNYLYATGSGLRASISPSALPDTLAINASVHLATPRRGHTMFALGHWLYVIGGCGDVDVHKTVERARVAPDGTLLSFLDVGGLDTARCYHAAAILGEYVYLFGGATSATNSDALTASIERAKILPDGSLGGFTSAGSLVWPTRDTAPLVTPAAEVYLLGGYIDGGTGGATVVLNQQASFTSTTLGTFQMASNGLTKVMSGHRVVVAPGSGASYSIYLTGNGSTNAECGVLLDEPVWGVAQGCSLPTLRVARYRAAQLSIGAAVYTFGGSPTDRSIDSAAGPDLLVHGLFAPVELQQARVGLSGIVLGDYYHLVGGADGVGTTLDSVETGSLK